VSCQKAKTRYNPKANILKHLSDTSLSLLAVEENHLRKVCKDCLRILALPFIGRVEKKRQFYRYFSSVIGAGQDSADEQELMGIVLPPALRKIDRA
jgi:hypothetical protein